MKNIIKTLFLFFVATGFIFAQNVIGYTSFEEPATGGKYTDTGSSSENHYLVNNEGQASVAYDPGATGSELGFSSYYTNTLDDVGITDGDYIGVTDYTPNTDSYPDGSQGFQLSDCDGLVTVKTDSVYLNSTETYNVSLYYFIKDDTYEPADFVRIFIITESGTTYLLNTEGSDIDDLGIEGSWTRISQNVSNSSFVVVGFELQSNSGYEAIFVDNIVVSQGNIPPTAVAGRDQIVTPGSVVTLDGSESSDNNGTISSWQWTQIYGTTVSLSTPTEATTSFTAPETPDSLVFTLTVTDNDGDSDTDTVSVVVRTITIPPVFFSEYVEGSTGSNKFLEIYNGSDAAVDLNAENIVLAISSNGENNFSTETQIADWGHHGVIEPGGVLILASADYTFDVSPDTAFAYPSPLHFNGNDAVALMIDGVIFDIIGDPSSSDDIIKDVVLRRNSNISAGNPVFSFDEWSYGTTDDVSGLGMHIANPNAPVITNISYTPEFVTSANEIEISAVITPIVGTIGSLSAFYGSDGSLINESTNSWEENAQQHLWKVILPTQPGDSKIDVKLVATDTEGNSGESAVISILIAADNPTNIADIHSNISTMDGAIKTVEGIITIGAGKLRDDRTSVYIQDESGRGLNLYSSELLSDLERGAKVKAVGVVELYYTTVEITDFSYKIISTNNDLPAAKILSVAGVNSDDNEGTLVQFHGKIADRISMTSGTKLKISEDEDTTAVMIWNTTGIDAGTLTDGNSYWFTGVGSQYSGEYQVLVAYDEDIKTETAVDDIQTRPFTFKLDPAYPNPFNPTTTICWELGQSGNYRLSLYNLIGQEVKVIDEGQANPGKYSIVLNAGNLHSGVYFVRLETEKHSATQKIILLK